MQNKLSVFQKISIALVRVYQCAVSPFVGGRAACRFTPTCSEYTKIAIEKHGCIRGTIMGLRRISRCRPGGGYGYDPVS